MTTTPQPRVDGRTARSGRTRNAIIDAYVHLVEGGDLRPTADRVAKVAGVSLRALWSHFADMEALIAASAQRMQEHRDAAYEPVPSDLPLEKRIDAYCHQRARLLEQLAPAARSAALKAPFSPSLQGYRQANAQRLRDELATLFAPELLVAGDAAGDVLAAMTAVSMWPTWEVWRSTLGLDADAAFGALRRAITALLCAPALPRG